MSTFRPRKRQQGIKVEAFQGEILVYDLDRHNAHCLNGVAVDVWNKADGAASVAEIAAALGGDEATVWRALEELENASLLEGSLPDAGHDAGRREALAKLGWAAALPLVLSMAVPTPAAAQSIGPTGPI